MSDDYLWDRSGEPDPEVQRLESALARFRHNRPAPRFPHRLTAWDPWRRVIFPLTVSAAAAVLVVVATRFTPRPTPRPEDSQVGWQVTRLAGEPKIGDKSIGGTAHLRVGEWLQTDEASRATVDVSSSGRVEIDSNTRVRLVETRPGQDRKSVV